ncbi:MAG TPA: hypothetical protein VK824_06510 [Planctomycetota bacterium]|nr:hypothetical protein [Planctomycetota bacterium]
MRTWPAARGVLLIALAACAPSSVATDEAPEAGLLAQPAPMPALTAQPPGAPGTEDPAAGTWWVLAPAHPYLALRLSLVGTDDAHALVGHWISFDWRASRQAEALVRRSKPVAVRATRAGTPAAPGAFVVDGPMPMLDEDNVPNGQHGSWHLQLQPANLPGEPLRFHGTGVHSAMAPEQGVDVDLVRDYRVWTP